MNKKIFENTKEEQEFYDNLDYYEYLKDMKPLELDFSNVKSSTKSISIRLPISLLQQISIQANSLDIPYQSLIKVYLKEGLERL